MNPLEIRSRPLEASRKILEPNYPKKDVYFRQ